MTWNGSPTKIIRGKCAVCPKIVERKVSIHTARQIKTLTCGGYRCKQKLNIQRHQEMRDRKKITNASKNKSSGE